MRLEQTFQLDAPLDRAFAFLTDVDRVAGCIPGVEGVEHCDDGTYEAGLRIQLGPIKAAFTGDLELEPHPPDRLEARGSGRDRSSGSRAEVAFTGILTAVDGGARTEVATVADVTIRGRLGQFGTGVIRATATEVIRDFVRCSNARLAELATVASPVSAGADGVDKRSDDGTTSPARPTQQPAAEQLGLLWRVLVNLVRNAFGRVREASRRRSSRGG